MVADVTRKMLGKIPVSKYPCAWCPSQHFSPEELNWVDDADDFICSACIQRNYSSKRRETGRVVNLLDVMEEARELEIAGENDE